MIMKISGCILILLSTTGIGYLLGSEYLRRIEDLRAIKSIVFLLQGDIRYGNTMLSQAFSNAARRHGGSLADFLKEVSIQLEEGEGLPFYDIWKNAQEKHLKDRSFSKKDKHLLEELAKNLGYQEKEMQLKSLEGYGKEVEEKLTQLSAEMKEKTRLYRMLGILAGIFVVILVL